MPLWYGAGTTPTKAPSSRPLRMCRQGSSSTVTRDFRPATPACTSTGRIFRHASAWRGMLKATAALHFAHPEEPFTTFPPRATCWGPVTLRHGIQSSSGIMWISKILGQAIPVEIHSRCPSEGLLAATMRYGRLLPSSTRSTMTHRRCGSPSGT